MRMRLWWAWMLGATLAACARPVVYVPADPPPVVHPQPPPPPVQPPPVVPPPTAPADVAGFLDRIAIGATLAEVAAAVGKPSTMPAQDGGPPTARWDVLYNEGRFVIYAVFADGKVARKGYARVETVR